jgi:ParB/RepB/Spo0J family partition protein
MTTATLEAPSTHVLLSIPIGSIVPDPNNQYRPTTKAFEDSIADQGVLEPILVCKRDDGHYDLIAGERRWRASQKAGHTTISAVARELTEQQRVVIQTIENLLRSDYSFTQHAVQCGRLLDLGMTRAVLAKKLGQKPAWVSARLKILNAPTALWPYIDSHVVSLDDLDELKAHFDNTEVMTLFIEQLADGRRVGRPGYFCDEAAAKLAATQQRNELEAELTAQSVQIIPPPEQCHKGVKALSELGITGHAVKLHAREACHGARIVTSWNHKVTVVLMCVDPKRHTTKGGSMVKTPGGTTKSVATEQRLATQRRLRECAIQRDEAAYKIIGETLNQRDTTDLMCTYILATVSSETARLVAKHLDLITPEMKGYQPWPTIIGNHGATSPKAAVTVARLVAYHHAANGWSKEFRRNVSALLTAKGWAPLHSDDPFSPNADPDTPQSRNELSDDGQDDDDLQDGDDQ